MLVYSSFLFCTVVFCFFYSSNTRPLYFKYRLEILNQIINKCCPGEKENNANTPILNGFDTHMVVYEGH